MFPSIIKDKMFNKPKRFIYHVVKMFEDNIFKNSCHFMRELLLVFGNRCLKVVVSK